MAQTAAVQAEPFVLAEAQAKSRAHRDAIRQTIVQFTRPSTLWPAEVKADVAAFVDGLYAQMSEAEALAQSTSPEGFMEMWNAQTEPTDHQATLVAAQKIRLKLGLSADAKASCKL